MLYLEADLRYHLRDIHSTDEISTNKRKSCAEASQDNESPSPAKRTRTKLPGCSISNPTFCSRNSPSLESVNLSRSSSSREDNSVWYRHSNSFSSYTGLSSPLDDPSDIVDFDDDTSCSSLTTLLEPARTDISGDGESRSLSTGFSPSSDHNTSLSTLLNISPPLQEGLPSHTALSSTCNYLSPMTVEEQRLDDGSAILQPLSDRINSVDNLVSCGSHNVFQRQRIDEGLQSLKLIDPELRTNVPFTEHIEGKAPELLSRGYRESCYERVGQPAAIDEKENI
jgi:hypothetical protein